MARTSASSARAGRAVKSGRPMRRRIDFSDIPEASPAQLQAMRRGLGYQSLINDLLAKHVARVRSA